MIIELKGVEFENKGAELMLCAVLDRIEAYWPDAEIALTPSVKASFLQRTSVSAWQKLSLRKLYLDLNSFSYHLPSAVRRYLRKWGVVTEADIDVVIDASGFSYSDQWSPKMSIRHLSGELIRNHKHNKPYIFMPQAMGPFSDPQVRAQIANSFPKAALVCAREADTFNYIHQITGDFSTFRQFGDFTNAVKGLLPDGFDLSQPLACIVPNKNMVNPRNKNKQWLACYESTVLTAVKLYRSKGLTPFFLNHEGHEDGELIARLNQQLDQPLMVIEELDPRKVKGIIAASTAVFCSRFHGCISALSNGIACISTSWSHKYERLHENYTATELLLAPEATEAQLDALIDTSLDKNNELHKQINIKAAEFKLETEKLWQEVKAIIDAVAK
ncbi:polysaccharide pyruvyl transferase family protein [Shewanella eurypsychrophilus]|uniref:Polysaccharide pyruvyl transferase family protein n=1 Tax=Shewanella eurypsychrophilus TaxID=2593656 RepID=A0ABX6V8I5_9GAMM|nr:MULTISPECIES: polysaccharide pyruvyl transferase family protein [Shewanella]QFU23439.1 polysaccharide pyruvyl transferase family protein [Shewanella sp. YLB-09]QPG58667.1 polysaccharide pyruvyl transferase family protein [Shewanella eurypsychrophilus]